MSSLPSKRLYIRNLPRHVGEGTLLKYLSSYGKIEEIKIIHDYAFVQFDTQEDARDVLETFQQQPFLGSDIIVEFARPLQKDTPSEKRSTGNSILDFTPRISPTNFQSRYPVVVTNIPRKIRWQELKDFGRIPGGLVAFCDLDKKKRGRGFIEYFSQEEAERAIKELDGKCLGGKRVKLSRRPEVFSRRQARSRSQSPERYESGHFRRSYDESRVFYTSIRSRPDSNEHRHRGSPPPPYRSEDPDPSSSFYPQSSLDPSRYHASPRVVDDGVSAASHNAPRNVDTHEEQYDYASHALTVDAWKYDYNSGHEYNHTSNTYPKYCHQGFKTPEQVAYCHRY